MFASDIIAFHVYARGVDGRDIYMGDSGRRRFLATLRYMNTHENVKLDNILNAAEPYPTPDDPLVALLAYTLLDNHFHLVFVQHEAGGMTEFLRKIGTGYTHYFNKRHTPRRGRLFESRLHHNPITSDAQLWHTIAYTHLNILDMFDKRWRDGTLDMPWSTVRQHLATYQWSSVRAYMDTQQHDPLLDYKAISDFIGKKGMEMHDQYLQEWSTRGLPYFFTT